ncbi:hypothetical protein E2C01_032583 [Portunus trituberculatus]|uniref:Uncharacterized protein n=1 Tax=Portunus trituberculatus TaxID=210409 RepID=A0A5B7F371_PORTR|nr:hypothetical protein [Portunus trituberculatus]
MRTYSEASCVQRILTFTAIHVAVSYCPNHQSLVNAIVSSGAAISLLMSTSFIFYLNEKYCFRGATLIFSGLCLNMCVAAMITNLASCIFGCGISFTLNTMIIIEIMGTDMLLPVLGLCGLISAVWHIAMGPLQGERDNETPACVA